MEKEKEVSVSKIELDDYVSTVLSNIEAMKNACNAEGTKMRELLTEYEGKKAVV